MYFVCKWLLLAVRGDDTALAQGKKDGACPVDRGGATRFNRCQMLALPYRALGWGASDWGFGDQVEVVSSCSALCCSSYRTTSRLD